MKKEIWLPVEGYENYEVSNEGRVRSLNYNKTRKTKILKQRMTRDGYLMVGLYKDSKQKFFSVHRLVALVFVPNIFGDDCISSCCRGKLKSAYGFVWKYKVS